HTAATDLSSLLLFYDLLDTVSRVLDRDLLERDSVPFLHSRGNPLDDVAIDPLVAPPHPPVHRLAPSLPYDVVPTLGQQRIHLRACWPRPHAERSGSEQDSG